MKQHAKPKQIEYGWDLFAEHYNVPEWFVDGKLGVDFAGVFHLRFMIVGHTMFRNIDRGCMALRIS